MTSTGGRPAYADLSLDESEVGTLLGTFAWVMGALEIMSDRAEAVDEPELGQLRDRLMPRLEALLESLTRARRRSPFAPAGQMEPAVEAAYASVRQGFEAWIKLTALETAQAAAAVRQGESEKQATDPADGA